VSAWGRRGKRRTPERKDENEKRARAHLKMSRRRPRGPGKKVVHADSLIASSALIEEIDGTTMNSWAGWSNCIGVTSQARQEEIGRSLTQSGASACPVESPKGAIIFFSRRTEHRLEAYATLRRRVVNRGCTAIAPGMSLRDRSTVRKTM
jgi:hypothetical protein